VKQVMVGCQVKIGKEIDGLVVKLSSMTRNLQSSDLWKGRTKPQRKAQLKKMKQPKLPKPKAKQRSPGLLAKCKILRAKTRRGLAS